MVDKKILKEKSITLIGEGSYGCVYSPSVRCSRIIEFLNKKTVNSKTLISKVYSRSNDFETEIQFLKSIKDIDPKGKYFVVPNKTCTTTVKTILNSNPDNECSLLESIDTEKKLYQILMPNAGLSLLSFFQEYYTKNKSKYSLREWIKSIKGILEAIKLLNTNSLVHRDIKSDNIVFNGKTLKVIDLGLMVPNKEVYLSRNKHVLEFNYLSYPYEFLLVYFEKYASNFQKNTVNKLVNFKQSLESFGSDVADTFYLLHSKTNIEKAIEDLDRWKNNTKNWFSIIKKNIDKVDIYSFGTVCIELDSYFDKSTLSKDELILYYDFMYKITMVDFRYRANIEEAIKLHSIILKK